MLSALVVNKAVAVYVGPSGLAIIGQFQNFSKMLMTVARGAISIGVTKYTAEYRNKDSERLNLLLGTASRITIACSATVAVGLVLFSKYISEYILKSQDFSYIFVVFGFTIILFALNSLLLSILNGLKEIKTFISINIIQSLYGLIFTSLLVVFWGLHGALIALATNQSIIFLVVVWMLRKHELIKLTMFKGAFDSQEAKKLSGYALMSLTTAATIPVSHIIVRNYLGETLGWDQAGYWQAIWYISSMYLMVVSTALSIYYLPRLSEINCKLELRKELRQGYLIIMPIVFVMALSIFFLKDFIVWLLFSEDFQPMRELFLWQLTGDCIKLASLLLGYIIVAKEMKREYMLTEMFFAASFVGLSLLFVNKFGVIGMTYAYATNYAIHLLAMIYLTREKLF